MFQTTNQLTIIAIVKISTTIIIWLVVLTILKNTSQWEGLSHIFWKKTCSKPPTSTVFVCICGLIPLIPIFDPHLPCTPKHVERH